MTFSWIRSLVETTFARRPTRAHLGHGQRPPVVRVTVVEGGGSAAAGARPGPRRPARRRPAPPAGARQADGALYDDLAMRRRRAQVAARRAVEGRELTPRRPHPAS